MAGIRVRLRAEVLDNRAWNEWPTCSYITQDHKKLFRYGEPHDVIFIKHVTDVTRLHLLPVHVTISPQTRDVSNNVSLVQHSSQQAKLNIKDNRKFSEIRRKLRFYHQNLDIYSKLPTASHGFGGRDGALLATCGSRGIILFMAFYQILRHKCPTIETKSQNSVEQGLHQHFCNKCYRFS